MPAQKEIIVEQGPDPRGNHVGSTVVQTAERRFWVSTVDLGRKPKAYETLVFPIPPGITVIRDSEENPSFSADFPLDERGFPMNITNMPKKSIARRYHGETVQELVNTLTGGVISSDVA